MARLRWLALGLIVALAAAGCTTAPDGTRHAPTPAEFKAQVQARVNLSDVKQWSGYLRASLSQAAAVIRPILKSAAEASDLDKALASLEAADVAIQALSDGTPAEKIKGVVRAIVLAAPAIMKIAGVALPPEIAVPVNIGLSILAAFLAEQPAPVIAPPAAPVAAPGGTAAPPASAPVGGVQTSSLSWPPGLGRGALGWSVLAGRRV